MRDADAPPPTSQSRSSPRGWATPAPLFTLSVYAHSKDDVPKAAASSFGRIVTTRDTETGLQG